MKEAIIHKGPRVEIIDSPIRKAGPGQGVIKVVVSGSKPKDWYVGCNQIPNYIPMNMGDGIAGIVYEVGEGRLGVQAWGQSSGFPRVYEARRLLRGIYCELGVYNFSSWSRCIVRGSYRHPRRQDRSNQSLLAPPSDHLTSKPNLSPDLRRPIAVGSYAPQLPRGRNIHPLLCIAGRATPHVESLIDRSKGDTIIDYRQPPSAIIAALHKALNGAGLNYVFDAVGEHGSTEIIFPLLPRQSGKVTAVRPYAAEIIPKDIDYSFTIVGAVHGFPTNLRDFGFVFLRYLGKSLTEGWFKAQAYEVIPGGGLGGVDKGLKWLKDGTVSGRKYVFRIGDTVGVEGRSS